MKAALKTVAECTLRGHHTHCPVCDRMPPDYCGQMDIEEVLCGTEETEGTDTTEGTEEAVSDAPKGRKKRAVTA